MKYLFSFLSLVVVFPCSAADMVRVLLSEERQPIELSSPAPIDIVTDKSRLNLDHPKMNLRISRQATGWTITVANVNKQIKPLTYSLEGKSLSLRSTSLNWNGHKVEFPVSLFHKSGRYQLVGHMDIENYLKGVLPHEMPSSWPVEALKAQAVASRSYALWKAQHQESQNYDLRSSILDQMFRMNKINESSSVPPKVQEALASTAGVFLVDKNDKIIKTYFHSDCGGATDGPRNVWGTENSQGAIRDVACAQRSSSQWKSEWSLPALREKLRGEFILPDDAELKDVIVRTQLKSQRAEWVDLIFAKGVLKRVRGEDVRRVLGYDKIRSTLFAIEKTNGAYTFKGRGFGHGVGLCQYGARAMAQAGQDYKTILKHYYPSSNLRPSLKDMGPSDIAFNDSLFVSEP